MFCIIASSLLFALLSWIISKTYHPDMDSIMATAKERIFLHYEIRPEPLESALFFISLVFFPLSLLVLYAVASSRRFRLSGYFADPRFSKLILSVGILACVVFSIAAFTSDNPFYGAGLVGSDSQKSCFGAYFFGLKILTEPALILLLFFLLLVCFRWFSKQDSKLAKSVSWLLRASGYIMGGLLLLYILLINTTSFPESWQGQFDMNAVYYSQTQVYAGIPMLVDHFTNTYGFYPHFLNPVFQVAGLDVSSFTFVMSLLIVLSFICLYFVLRFSTKNDLIRILGFVSVMFFPYISIHTQSLTDYDSYFAAFPSEPSSLAWFCCWPLYMLM